jgi:hypothetical protein
LRNERTSRGDRPRAVPDGQAAATAAGQFLTQERHWQFKFFAAQPHFADRKTLL